MAKGGGPGPQQQGGGESLDLLWIIVLVIVAVLLTWYFAKSHIATVVFFVKYYEILAIKFVLEFWGSFAATLHLPTASTRALDEWLNYINASKGDYRGITFAMLSKAHADIGFYMRFPIALILLGLGSILYFTSATTRFKNIFSMDSLKNSEKLEWPRIYPVINLKLLNEDINIGPWAMAMPPMQFGKKYNLLKEEVKDGRPAVTLIRGKAHEVFALQLGTLWNGNLNSLRPHIQALLAIFAARIDGNIKEADDFLDKIAISAVSGKPNFSGARQLLAKHINCKAVVKVMQSHAYVTTMVASMLEASRVVGVMATADFIWLKPYDRRLWYILNSIGRQTAAPEAAGIFSHWLAERRLARPMKVPAVEAAVQGLEEAIQDVLYEPAEA